MFTYKPLWKQLIEKDITKTQLREEANFTKNTLAKMSKNEYIAMSILDKICKVLNCKIDEIIEYVDK